MFVTAAELAAQMPDASRLLSDEPEIESSLHYTQLLILFTCLEWLWRDHSGYFIGANLTTYFSFQELRNRDFRGPDFFLVKDVANHPRTSWVVWEEEGRYPNLIIELLSNSTASTDRTIKKELYQNRFRTPEYFWFSPETLEFAGFRLIGHSYKEIPKNASGWYWSEELSLYLGIYEKQLRYFTSEGELVPTPTEEAQQALQRERAQYRLALEAQARAEQQANLAEQERLRAEELANIAEQERLRAELLAAKLRELGIDTDL